ncbi:MAG TPA: tryptophan--tRNA ligase [Candidatus Gastranaerophilales bacterium]|nr:tryptophan--tRNA ligase [Candidatus Gastranaerophilales bacterium]
MQINKKRIMSGMRPTGKLHIGHYMGVLKNWLAFQDEYESFFCVADWHALTTKYDQTEDLRQNITDVAMDWIASGINPEQSTIYVQSLIPETAELHLLLSMITPQNWVERDTTLKDMVKILRDKTIVQAENAKKIYLGKKELDKTEVINAIKNEQIKIDLITYGLLGYPVLQTADIIQFNASLVPVGKDQLAHLEISRDITRRFNHIYKTDFFIEPQPKLTETPLLKGIDGQKMGKSFNNDIKISDSEEETTKKIMRAITDRSRIKKTDPGHPQECEVVCPYYEIFADAETVKKQRYECENAIRGCADCKRELAEIMNNYFFNIRSKRKELESNHGYIKKIIETGSEKAREQVCITLKEVKKIMKMYN